MDNLVFINALLRFTPFLLAAMIRGNHDNCREFATQRWLRVFVDQLSSPAQSHHVLNVIECLITDSPEVLHIISQRDIGSIVKLLHSNGRDAKVGGAMGHG